MSRIAFKPVAIPGGVEVSLAGQSVSVKGKVGQLNMNLHDSVTVTQNENELIFNARDEKTAVAMIGTMRALVQNMIKGVSEGFEKKLKLIGVGYRAAVQGKKVNLSLGFSHPVEYEIPDGITVEAPSQTDLVIKGADKQKVGQVAAEIRFFRPPEPYKGKGIRYDDEHVKLKEAKKK
ncbi:MAG: 50S ribosomal protein L6 [Gammaproteobacteria bacterium]|nr:MAG: 50S ribosomal protein L6 [Gammaproteobacteria bacterium]